MSKSSTKSVPTVKQAGKSLADFRATYDKSYIVPAKIKAALEKLGDGWEYNIDFARIADVSIPDLTLFAEQFEPHIVNTKGRTAKRIWFGNPKVAAEARKLV